MTAKRTPEEAVEATRWALDKPRGGHVVTTSLMGKTAEHLATDHPSEVSDGTTVGNLRAHFRAHRDEVVR